MGNRSVTMIIGCHGSGKTTLAKKILGNKTVVQNARYSKYTLSRPTNPEQRAIAAVGTYQTACGGCDSVKKLCYTFHTMNYIVQKESSANIVIEGILLSNVFSTPLKNLLQAKYEYNLDVEICFLYVSQAKSFERVMKRNGGKDVNKNVIKRKQEGAIRLFRKYIETGEFRCLAIDTTALDSEQVFERFKKWSAIYR